MYWQYTTAPALSELAAMNPVVSNANNAIDSFTSASSVGYPLDDASIITHTAESISRQASR